MLFALEKIVPNCSNQDAIALLSPELAIYKELIAVHPKYERLIHLARFDFIETDSGQFKLLETNTECPGGIIQKGLRQISFEAAASVVPMIREALPGQFHPHWCHESLPLWLLWRPATCLPLHARPDTALSG